MQESPPQFQASSSPLSQSVSAWPSGSSGATPQEVFKFFSDPSAVIQRARKAFLGNCDWVMIDDSMELIEWVPKYNPETRKFEQTWITPPQHRPTVDNYELWTYMEGMISNYCSVYFLLNKPSQPEDLATTIGLDITRHLKYNWVKYNMNLAKFHYVRNCLSDMIYSVLKASENGDIRKILTHIYQFQGTAEIKEGPETPIEQLKKEIGLKK